jgi:phosphopantothenoylcysteine decarboxylase/phosphopantothenate--cysteine ligase
MGYSIALEAAKLGADVVLVSGPSHLTINHANIKLISVVSAQEMYQECHRYFKSTHAAIMCAAVADYTPEDVSNQKIKKNKNVINISLKKTKDILKSLGEIKEQQVLIGFALETENEIENAKQKLINKNLDFIVLNSLNDKGAGFKHQTNKVSILDSDNKMYKFELKTKQEVAKDIITHLIKKFI